MLLAGAATFIVHLVARSVITAFMDPIAFTKHPLWVPINALGIVGAALVILGLPAAYTQLLRAGGLLSVTGVVLVSVAWMFLGLFVSLYAALVAPWLADHAPGLLGASAPSPAGVVIAFLVALLAELLGSVLLGVPFIRGHLSPRWVGYALPTAAVLTIVGDLIASAGPARDLAVNLFSNVGPMLLMVALATLGARVRRSNHTRSRALLESGQGPS